MLNLRKFVSLFHDKRKEQVKVPKENRINGEAMKAANAQLSESLQRFEEAMTRRK